MNYTRLNLRFQGLWVIDLPFSCIFWGLWRNGGMGRAMTYFHNLSLDHSSRARWYPRAAHSPLEYCLQWCLHIHSFLRQETLKVTVIHIHPYDTHVTHPLPAWTKLMEWSNRILSRLPLFWINAPLFKSGLISLLPLFWSLESSINPRRECPFHPRTGYNPGTLYGIIHIHFFFLLAAPKAPTVHFVHLSRLI